MYWLDVIIAPHSRFLVEGSLPYLPLEMLLRCDYVWFHLSPYKINASFEHYCFMTTLIINIIVAFNDQFIMKSQLELSTLWLIISSMV
jgi:hypothetical protein